MSSIGLGVTSVYFWSSPIHQKQVAALARRNAENRYKKMDKTNAAKKRVRRTPTLAQIQGWIDRRLLSIVFCGVTGAVATIVATPRIDRHYAIYDTFEAA